MQYGIYHTDIMMIVQLCEIDRDPVDTDEIVLSRYIMVRLSSEKHYCCVHDTAWLRFSAC